MFCGSIGELAWKKGDMHGKVWICLVIDGEMELGGWEDRTRRMEDSKVAFLLILLCCACQLVDYRASCVVVERRNLLPLL